MKTLWLYGGHYWLPSLLHLSPTRAKLRIPPRIRKIRARGHCLGFDQLLQGRPPSLYPREESLRLRSRFLEPVHYFATCSNEFEDSQCNGLSYQVKFEEWIYDTPPHLNEVVP
jgi:hypothetical protein